MQTQIVYVLTFDEENYYFEQAWVSACSARMHNPSARILVVTDTESEAHITGWRKSIFDYVDEVRAFPLPEGLNPMMKSRWLKTSLRNLIDGDFLFMDTDTVICRPLDAIDHTDGELNAVRDLHCTPSEAQSYYMYRKFRQAGVPITDNAIYFNSGVMRVKDTPRTRAFYTAWHETWKETVRHQVFIDQVALHAVNTGPHPLITELSGAWNCQIEGRFLNYLHEAYLIHYFAYTKDSSNAPFYFKDKQVYEQIRAHQALTPEVLEQLKHPYAAFTTHYEMLSGKALACYHRFKPFFVLDGSPRRFRLFTCLAGLLMPKS